jgi:arylsulfatase A-like enzyme
MREIGGTGENVEYLAGMPGYTDLLSEAGYVCGISGKWHLGYGQKPQKSFDHWFVFKNVRGYLNNTFVRNDSEVRFENAYTTDFITEEALGFLDTHGCGEKPFYLSVHYNAPHAPWVGCHPQDIVDSYDDCPFKSCPQEPDHPWACVRERQGPDARENLKGYFAAVTAMDRQVGRILDKLSALGIREDTFVCFMSDNGFNCGHHGIWGKGNGTVPQNMYDTSVKIPAIFSRPGTIPAGVVNDEMLSQYDVFPTVLEWAEIANPFADALPGRSFAGMIRGSRERGNESVVVYDEYGPVRMIRTREWKYVHRYPFGPHELYDMVNDPEERRNRYDERNSERIVVQLRNELESWFNRYVDPDLDGAKKEVIGQGQRDLAGIQGRRKDKFHKRSRVQRVTMEGQYDLDSSYRAFIHRGGAG